MVRRIHIKNQQKEKFMKFLKGAATVIVAALAMSTTVSINPAAASTQFGRSAAEVKFVADIFRVCNQKCPLTVMARVHSSKGSIVVFGKDASEIGSLSNDNLVHIHGVVNVKNHVNGAFDEKTDREFYVVSYINREGSWGVGLVETSGVRF